MKFLLSLLVIPSLEYDNSKISIEVCLTKFQYSHFFSWLLTNTRTKLFLWSFFFEMKIFSKVKINLIRTYSYRVQKRRLEFWINAELNQHKMTKLQGQSDRVGGTPSNLHKFLFFAQQNREFFFHLSTKIVLHPKIRLCSQNIFATPSNVGWFRSSLEKSSWYRQRIGHFTGSNAIDW